MTPYYDQDGITIFLGDNREVMPTLVAAKLRGLQATGIEINEEYCKLAVERLRQGVLIPA